MSLQSFQFTESLENRMNDCTEPDKRDEIQRLENNPISRNKSSSTKKKKMEHNYCRCVWAVRHEMLFVSWPGQEGEGLAESDEEVVVRNGSIRKTSLQRFLYTAFFAHTEYSVVKLIHQSRNSLSKQTTFVDLFLSTAMSH
ncbi:hypothetical protein F2P81_007548 [Scophthalmus maximus]|uniref:Uncharacterized protein n=1 Tax=Scophthalmus maximus TaxID=52904 RepID=A0A6A4SZP3_SCOMX|nr:hypothetical protein F2P81_007548 [Scophthalmus maximus]